MKISKNFGFLAILLILILGLSIYIYKEKPLTNIENSANAAWIKYYDDNFSYQAYVPSYFNQISRHISTPELESILFLNGKEGSDTAYISYTIVKQNLYDKTYFENMNDKRWRKGEIRNEGGKFFYDEPQIMKGFEKATVRQTYSESIYGEEVIAYTIQLQEDKTLIIRLSYYTDNSNKDLVKKMKSDFEESIKMLVPKGIYE